MSAGYDYNVWLEVTMLPFIGVLAIFQYLRYAAVEEINKRSRLLTLSTFFATLLEIISTLLIGGWGRQRWLNLTVRTLYYAVENINAYYLMRYVESYVRIENKKLELFNIGLLISSFIILVLNITPGISGFFFSISAEGGLQPGGYNVMFRSLYVFYFITMACYHQITNRQYYTEKAQFAVMSTVGALLVIAFIIQYAVLPEVLFSYAVCAILLIITFFYYEAPMYRRMATVEKELEESRIKTEQSTKMANAANRAKSDFLANTSHEIRTPMNAILGMNEMILNESHDKDIKQASLDIRKAGTHLLSIINNILDISKIESGKMELYNADYHLWQMLQDIKESMFESINEKGLELILNINKEMPEHLHGDSDHLRQVIVNLLDNALKYTSHGKITLSVDGEKLTRGRIKLKISVEDTGIGIRKEDLKHLFKSFERVNLTETQNIQGAGLGLTLVRYLLNLMGGNIHADSEYGKGSKFSFEVNQQLSHDGFQGTIEEYEKEIASRAPVQEEYSGPFICPKAKLLIVDDTPVNLVVAKGMLNETKAQVETAESGEECLEKIKTDHYDIIFLDHKMPGLDGPETLKLAKELEGPSMGAAFIALTANSGSGLREEYINLGFNDYLPKPMKATEMKKILAMYLPSGLKEKI